MPFGRPPPLAEEEAIAQETQIACAAARQNGPNSIWRHLTRASAVIDVLASRPSFLRRAGPGADLLGLTDLLGRPARLVAPAHQGRSDSGRSVRV